MIKEKLSTIAKIVEGKLIGDPQAEICGVHFDSRVIQPGQLYIPIVGEKVDGHSFVEGLFTKGINASLWLEDSSYPKPQGNLIVVKDSQIALQKLAIYYRKQLKCRFVGITGSSGKTSSKDIIAAVLASKYKTGKTQGNQNNDIGVPVTICNMDETQQYAVTEMGIDDFGVMDRLVDMVQPDITVITSIGPAHIAQLKTQDNIVIQKCLINRDLKDGYAFYNHHSYGLKNQLESMNLTHKAISYGFEDSDIMAYDYRMTATGSEFECDGVTYRIPLLGKHLVLDSLAAIGIGRLCGLSNEEIQKGFDNVVITPHRLQLIKLTKATIIDDTYNANPGSLVASLQTIIELSNKIKKIVVLGDMLELGENSGKLHYQIADSIDFKQFEHIYLAGPQMINLADNLKKQGITYKYFETIEDIAENLKPYLLDENLIFFKASNGMKFSSIIDKLKEGN